MKKFESTCQKTNKIKDTFEHKKVTDGNGNQKNQNGCVILIHFSPMSHLQGLLKCDIGLKWVQQQELKGNCCSIIAWH